MRHVFRSLLLIIPCLAFSFPCYADLLGNEVLATTQSRTFELQWQSESLNEEQLAIEMEELYVTLYNAKKLQTIRYQGNVDDQIVAILRKNQLYYGAYFALGVDSVLCDLNPHICTRALVPSNSQDLQDITSHVGGYELSAGDWSNGELTQYINLPDLTFDDYTDLRVVDIGENTNIHQLLETTSTDCSLWAIDCSEVILEFNPHLRGKSQFTSDVTKAALPIKGIKSTLSLALEEQSDTAALLSDLELLDETRSVTAVTPSGTAFSAEWQQTLQKEKAIDLGLRALATNISATGSGKANSIPSAVTETAKESLLSLIAYPYIPISNLPAFFKQNVSVGVLDTWIDDDHCALGSKIEMVEPSRPGNPRPPAQNCGDVTLDTDPVVDHGTHVAGLITTESAHNNFHGLNPHASVKYFTIRESDLKEGAYREKIAQKLTQISFQHKVKLFNLSWEYANQIGKSDSIAEGIEFLQFNSLFVVAAGNNNVNFNNTNCPLLPACLTDYANVITVVGLDRELDTPSLWTKPKVGGFAGSNSSNKFHIAAIADRVLSTAANNHLGHLSGTSQAAPQVTAAASLLYAKQQAHFKSTDPYLQPLRVKNRLIYTSDIFPGMLDDVFGGRLNIEVALDMAVEYLEIVDPETGELQAYRGKIEKFENSKGEQDWYCKNSAGKDKYINKRQLRRIYYDENTHKFIVYWVEKNINGAGLLERMTDCNLESRTASGVIKAVDGSTIPFAFDAIRNYVAKMY